MQNDKFTVKRITEFKGKPLYNVLTVDPGFNFAMAWWRGQKRPVTFFKKGGQRVLHTYFKDTLQWLSGRLLRESSHLTVVIEGIDFRDKKKASGLPELGYLIGGLCVTCLAYSAEPIVIQAQTWKGCMNDKQVADRVFLISGKRYKGNRGGFNPHVTDAVGMGYYLTGEFSYENQNRIDW